MVVLRSSVVDVGYKHFLCAIRSQKCAITPPELVAFLLSARTRHPLHHNEENAHKEDAQAIGRLAKKMMARRRRRSEEGDGDRNK